MSSHNGHRPLPEHQTMQREVYTTTAPDGALVTTTTTTRTKLEEEETFGFGRGPIDARYCASPAGILRIAEIVLCLLIISLVSSVFGTGPFKGVLFGQTFLLVFAGIAMCISFAMLVVFFFSLHLTQLAFWPWRVNDFVFSLVASLIFLVLGFVEAYYATGAWANNCNDIGSDGIIHNGCRFIYEWGFAAFFCFLNAFLYAISALLAHRNRELAWLNDEGR